MNDALRRTLRRDDDSLSPHACHTLQPLVTRRIYTLGVGITFFRASHRFNLSLRTMGALSNRSIVRPPTQIKLMEMTDERKDFYNRCAEFVLKLAEELNWFLGNPDLERHYLERATQIRTGGQARGGQAVGLSDEAGAAGEGAAGGGGNDANGNPDGLGAEIGAGEEGTGNDEAEADGSLGEEDAGNEGGERTNNFQPGKTQSVKNHIDSRRKAFWLLQQAFFDQLLLSMKAKETAEQTKKLLSQGKQVVIAMHDHGDRAQGCTREPHPASGSAGDASARIEAEVPEPEDTKKHISLVRARLKLAVRGLFIAREDDEESCQRLTKIYEGVKALELQEHAPSHYYTLYEELGGVDKVAQVTSKRWCFKRDEDTREIRYGRVFNLQERTVAAVTDFQSGKRKSHS